MSFYYIGRDTFFCLYNYNWFCIKCHYRSFIDKKELVKINLAEFAGKKCKATESFFHLANKSFFIWSEILEWAQVQLIIFIQDWMTMKLLLLLRCGYSKGRRPDWEELLKNFWKIFLIFLNFVRCMTIIKRSRKNITCVLNPFFWDFTYLFWKHW